MGRNGARVAALCWAGLALGGCAATEKLVPAASSVGSAFGDLLSFHKADTVGGAPRAAADEPLECPIVEVLDGTASYRTYVGTDQDNASVRYQFSMGEVARDCTRSGKDLLLKVGVAGRVLLGPAGSPGAFTVPVRIAVRRDADGKAVAAKLFQVPATIQAGSVATDFQVVSDPIAVPLVSSKADGDYTILVGFDATPKPATPPTAAKGRHAGRAAAATP